jgi:hypothetical protein
LSLLEKLRAGNGFISSAEFPRLENYPNACFILREQMARKLQLSLAASHSQILFYRLEVFRALRGRPTFRSFTASRSFGSISHSRPTLVAFKRLARIIFRTLFAVTPKRFAASAVLMILMAQVYHSRKLSRWRYKTLDK